jgi:hypothetical protein
VWTTTGNAGIPAGSFVGTTDSNDFVTKTAGTERMRVTSAGNVGIGSTTPRGALEINSSTHGLVTPQVALTSLTTSTPVVNPVGNGAPIPGTLIYNTASAGTPPNDVTPGFYSWTGINWERISAQNTYDIITSVMTAKVFNVPNLSNFIPTTGLKILAFGPNDSVYFTIEMPSNWQEGTTIVPIVNWCPLNNVAHTVVWGLEYSWANVGVAHSGSSFAKGTTVTSASINTNYLTTLTATGSPSVGIDGGGRTVKSILICRLFLDSATTGLLGSDIAGNSITFRILVK